MDADKAVSRRLCVCSCSITTKRARRDDAMTHSVEYPPHQAARYVERSTSRMSQRVITGQRPGPPMRDTRYEQRRAAERAFAQRRNWVGQKQSCCAPRCSDVRDRSTTTSQQDCASFQPFRRNTSHGIIRLVWLQRHTRLAKSRVAEEKRLDCHKKEPRAVHSPRYLQVVASACRLF